MYTYVQSGVLRINCIDCLDRTNVAMFTVAKAALVIQFRWLGLSEDPATVRAAACDAGHVPKRRKEVWPEVILSLQQIFTRHGDHIASQYAGSGAMHKEALMEGGPEANEKGTYVRVCVCVY